MLNPLINFLYHLSGWVIVFVVLSWLIAGFYPLMSRMLAKVKVEQAAFSVLVYGLLPPTAASLALIILLLPDVAFSFVADHCHGLDCIPHTLQVALNSAQTIIIASMLVSLLICVCAMIALRLFYDQTKLQTLSRLAESTSSSYKILDSKAAVAWCSGLLQPEIFISRKLAETLTNEQMQVVLEHEQAHVKRRDNLRKWAVHWATIAWPKRYRMRIKQDLSNYTEHVCDLAAVRCQQEALDFIAVMETLKTCYFPADNHEVDANEGADRANNYKVRAQMLERAWESRNACHDTTIFTRWIPTVFMGSLWSIAVIFAVHTGHPVLEWMAG